MLSSYIQQYGCISRIITVSFRSSSQPFFLTHLHFFMSALIHRTTVNQGLPMATLGWDTRKQFSLSFLTPILISQF